MENLKQFQNLHRDKVGIIVAGGPSLSDTEFISYKYDVDKRKETRYVLFSVSKTYLIYKYENMPFWDMFTKYHFIGDRHIFDQFYEEINYIPCEGLFVSKGIYFSGLLKHPKAYYFRGNTEKGFYGEDIPNTGVHGGGTSTYLAMQFAYYMGIREAYVVGLDHYQTMSDQTRKSKYAGKHKGSFPLMVTSKEDINHFDKEYYPPGTTWYFPQINRMEESYRLAREAYEKDGRKLYNASVRTALSEQVLPRKNIV